MEKRCFKCGKVKSLDEFYKHSAMGDGHLNKCKECAKKDVREHRENNIDKVRLYDRLRAKQPKRKQYAREHTIDWRTRNPEKYHAHEVVSNAIRDGKLTKPNECTRCGEETILLHAHHNDYSKPLDVEWLCPICHSLAHHPKVIKEAKAHYKAG